MKKLKEYIPLIGTSSVKESDYLAKLLTDEGISCQVLNAKNDELEAHIIEKAGALGAVTVSTNMAGRGVDILLGGPQGHHSAKIKELGGLYVIGTNLYESLRIDKQLKGRAGRQGDPGITRFFISLEDDLIAKYGIENMIPKSFYPRKQEESLTNPIFAKKICQAQRIIQGQNYDLREELYSYSTLLTELRQYLYNLRMDILHHKFKDEVLQKDFPSLYEDLSGKDPLREFQMKLVEEFKLLQEEIEESIKEDYRKVELSAEAFEEIKEKIKGQETTWTYLVNDDSIEDILGLLKGLVKITGMNNFFAWVTFALEYGFYKFFGKTRNKD